MHLIFLPGASGSTAFWQPVMQRLSADHQKTVLAYPSFAGYPEHPHIDSFDDLQDYILDQIQQPCIVIAQSMGGVFAVQAALQKPELIKALVLVASSGGIDLSPFHVQDWRNAYQSTFLQHPNWFVNTQVDYSLQLNQIQQPVLLLWGDCDPISPVAVGHYLKQQFHNSSLHIVQGGDHLFAAKVVLETAEKVKDYLMCLEQKEV